MSLSIHVLSIVEPTHNKCYQAIRARPYRTTSWKATGQRFVSGPKLALWQDRAAFTGQSSLEAKNTKSVRWQRESLRTRRALPQRLTYINGRTGRGAAGPDLAIKTFSPRHEIICKERNSSNRGRACVHHAGGLWTCYSALCTLWRVSAETIRC